MSVLHAPTNLGDTGSIDLGPLIGEYCLDGMSTLPFTLIGKRQLRVAVKVSPSEGPSCLSFTQVVDKQIKPLGGPGVIMQFGWLISFPNLGYYL